MATLEELRKEARKLENKLNEKLVSYSKYGMNFFAMREEDRNPTSLRPEDTSNSLSIDIEETLSQVGIFKRLVLLGLHDSTVEGHQ